LTRTQAIVDPLDLLFRRIILTAQSRGALEKPVTVGDLLDEFVPYGAARRDGGFDTHDDYLHALMRLISGERSFVFGDDLMQDDLKAELETPNPDLSVIRTYAQTKLKLNTARIQEVLAGDRDIDLRPPTPIGKPRISAALAAARAERASTPTPEPMTEPLQHGAIQQAFDAYAGSQREGDAGPPAVFVDRGCPYCAQPLPAGRTVKFCPSCGLNLLVRRCPGCSAEIESGWKFCVTCGRKA